MDAKIRSKVGLGPAEQTASRGRGIALPLRHAVEPGVDGSPLHARELSPVEGDLSLDETEHPQVFELDGPGRATGELQCHHPPE